MKKTAYKMRKGEWIFTLRDIRLSYESDGLVDLCYFHANLIDDVTGEVIEIKENITKEYITKGLDLAFEHILKHKLPSCEVVEKYDYSVYDYQSIIGINFYYEAGFDIVSYQVIDDITLLEIKEELQLNRVLDWDNPVLIDHECDWFIEFTFDDGHKIKYQNSNLIPNNFKLILELFREYGNID